VVVARSIQRIEPIPFVGQRNEIIEVEVKPPRALLLFGALLGHPAVAMHAIEVAQKGPQAYVELALVDGTRFFGLPTLVIAPDVPVRFKLKLHAAVNDAIEILYWVDDEAQQWLTRARKGHVHGNAG